MNIDAYRAMLEAERAYLSANGWTEIDPDLWQHSHLGRGEGSRGGHAYNIQRQADRNEIRFFNVAKSLIYPPEPVEVSPRFDREEPV